MGDAVLHLLVLTQYRLMFREGGATHCAFASALRFLPLFTSRVTYFHAVFCKMPRKRGQLQRKVSSERMKRLHKEKKEQKLQESVTRGERRPPAFASVGGGDCADF